MKRTYKKPSASLFPLTLHLLSGSSDDTGEAPMLIEEGEGGKIDFSNPELAPERDAGDARVKHTGAWEDE